MPSTRHVSSTVTPAARSESGKCSTVGPLCGSSHTALVTSTSPTGAPLAKILRAVMRQPPVTRSALPEPAIQSEPPLLTSTKSCAATARRRASTGAGSRRQREGGRAAVAGENPQHLGELAVLGPTTAKLDRDPSAQNAMRFQDVVVFGYEKIVIIMTGRTHGKLGTQLMREIRKITSHDHLSLAAW